MRRMLDPTKVGGLPSTIEFDKDGNRKVAKNLGVDGKLTLKSLVNASNPDGDITKELGGGGSTLYEYTIKFKSASMGVDRIGKFYSSEDMGGNNKNRNFAQIFKQLIPAGSGYTINLPVSGYIKLSDVYYSLIQLELGFDHAIFFYLDPAKGEVRYSYNFINDNGNIIKNTASPRKANP